MRTALITLLGTLLLVACTARVKPAVVEVSPPGVLIGTDGGGNFCPPGQAKKGRC